MQTVGMAHGQLSLLPEMRSASQQPYWVPGLKDAMAVFPNAQSPAQHTAPLDLIYRVLKMLYFILGQEELWKDCA